MVQIATRLWHQRTRRSMSGCEKPDVEDGVRDGMTEADADEMRELKRRNRVLEQEVEILRRATAYFAKDHTPK